MSFCESSNSTFDLEQQQQQQRLNSSSSSLRAKKEKERNPLKWLYRKSDASIRQTSLRNKDNNSNQEQTDLAKYAHAVSPEEAHVSPDIIHKIEKLEEKIDAFIVCQFSMSRSTRSIGGSSVACQAVCDEEQQRPPYTTQRKKVNACTQTTELQTQTGNIQDQEKLEQTIQWNNLAIEVGRLIKSQSRLSASVDTLSSSSVLDLIEMLSFSIERLQSEIVSLHKQNDNIHREQMVRNSHEDFQRKQFNSQVNVMQQLGGFLRQREEQLKQEREMNAKYKKNIEGLEEMVQVLELEWERVLPLISHSAKNRGIGELSKST